LTAHEGPVRLSGLERISQSALGVGDHGLEVVALANHRGIQLDTGSKRPAQLVVGMACCRVGSKIAVVRHIDLVQSAAELSGAPSLVDAQVCDDVRRLETAIAGLGATGAKTSPACDEPRSEEVTDYRNLGFARRFGGDCRREAVAELGSVAHQEPAAVTGVRTGERTPVRRRRVAIEVEERLRTAKREARPLDKGAVRAEVVRGRNVAAVLVFRHAEGDIAAHRAVFGLVTRIRRDVAASTEVAVIGKTVVDIVIRPTPGEVAVLAPAIFGTDPAADLDAHIGAGDVVKPDPIQAANLHVLDRLGLYGKISCLRPSYGNETRCRAKEKAFHHLHLEPPNIVS